jgi:hypothetical protein
MSKPIKPGKPNAIAALIKKLNPDKEKATTVVKPK